MAATWHDKIIPIVRGLISDMGPTYSYNDSRVEQLAVVSAVFVNMDVDFGATYTVDITKVSITPDPVNDSDFIALVSLRTACLITNGQYINDSSKAIAVKDGPSTIDMRDRVGHKKNIAEDACEAYHKAMIAFKMGDGTVGQAIVGPYASGVVATGTTRFV